MGVFSWRNQDTGKAIMNNMCGASSHECVSTISDNKGNKWIENSYGGYGVFGGKDYYSLLAEMNPELSKKLKPNVDFTDEDSTRDVGIDIEFGNHSGVNYPNLNEDESAPYIKGSKPLNANGQGHWDEDYTED